MAITLISVLSLVCALALPLAAAAQSYPAKPVRIIVPTAPGGGMDNTARVVGGKLQEYWGQSVLVENRAGAPMIIGAEAAAKSSPDGHTLLVAHDGTMAMNPVVFATLPYDPQRDFAPVSLLTMAPLVYLGMVHNMGGFKARVVTARKYLKDFGVGAFCGFGRMPPAEMPRILKEHQQAVGALRK